MQCFSRSPPAPGPPRHRRRTPPGLSCRVSQSSADHETQRTFRVRQTRGHVMTASKPILCAVDLSPGSDRVLAQAAELAQLTASELELLYVYRPPILPLEEGDPDDDEV